MGVTEWVILAAAVAAVLMIYLITRRNNGPNPWRDMEDESDALSGEAQQGAAHDDRDVIVDPSVAGEWEDFTPERQEPLVEPARDVDDINPASIRDEPVPEADLKKPSEAMIGFVSEPRPVRASTQSPEPARKEPGKSRRPQPEPPRSQAAEPAADGENQKIVVLHVVAAEGEKLHGPAIHAALAQCNLQFGERDVYHRIAEVDGQSRSVFSVANMLKPGTLKPDKADRLHTKGLVMFMLLPGPVDGNKAFHDMLHTAQSLADRLQARVLDDKRLPLTRQAAQYQIDEIAELERRRRLAHA